MIMYTGVAWPNFAQPFYILLPYICINLLQIDVRGSMLGFNAHLLNSVFLFHLNVWLPG